MRKVTIISVSLLTALALSGCGKSNAPQPSPGAGTTTGGGGTATVDAQAIVKQNCTSCHGANLEGSVGPKLSTIGGKYSKDQIAGIIANGRGAMPAFKGKLTDADINALSDWLAAKK